MQTATDVTCPACACVCDDLTLKIEHDRVVEVAPDCPIADRWFRENSQPIVAPTRIDGAEAPMAAAIEKCRRILREADYPLIYGLARSSTEGQRAALHLGDAFGAVIDTTASVCHGPSIIALQSVGESTCTLGEVRNRCDLVLFWGCNPAATHPRHAERYSVFASGMLVPGGRSDRTVVMIGDERDVHQWRLDADGSKPDVVIPLASGGDFEAINTLRMLLKGMPVEGGSRSHVGASLADLRRLAELMQGCRSGIVFFGLGLTGTSTEHPTTDTLGHANVECLLKMVEELNAVTRFYARRMRLMGDVSGADSVLCWQTGYPFSVDLSRGYPRYNPGEYSAGALLERGEVDACLIVGSETIPAFSSAARRHLEKIPTIVLDYAAVQTCFTPTVRIATAAYGLHEPGTIYRMDEVPLRLGGYLPSELPTDEEVLRQFL